MSVAVVIDAMGLPLDARVDQRVPKKLLLEHGAPTGSDKRQIQDGVEDLIWVAALKPTNIGTPAFRDEVREYLEIAVLTVSLRPDAKTTRLIELVHRAVPYPVVVVAEQDQQVRVSLAHKRWSQGESNKVVIEEVLASAAFSPLAPTPQEAAFLQSLQLAGMVAGDMFALYQGWIDRVAAMEASRITGTYAPPATPAQAGARLDALNAHATLQREIAALRSQAEKEKQLNRRVALNLEIKRLEQQMADAVSKL